MHNTIAFHSNQLGERGTEVALFDYARHNQDLLGNKSVIIYNENSPSNHADVVHKFASHFDLFAYQEFDQVDSIVLNRGIDLLYVIKTGNIDHIISKSVPTMVHAVFGNSLLHRHGSSYAYVSQWLSDRYSFGLIPYVPHIVHPSEQPPHLDLRAELCIPPNALVLGGYGGKNSFDIDFVKYETIPAILSKRVDIYFIFMNFLPFIQHPRVLFLPPCTDPTRKQLFVSTCDAMLHARHIGETFGLACAEFSVQRKPVYTFRDSPDRCHHMLLGNSLKLYSDSDELISKILALSNLSNEHEHDSLYAQYTPEFVMSRFDKHLINPALAYSGKGRSFVTTSYTVRRSLLDTIRALALKAKQFLRRMRMLCWHN